MRSLIEHPPAEAKAQFSPDFGQRFLVTIDTEEEFDWNAPLTRDKHGNRHVTRIEAFQQFCENNGVVPIWLVDWPIATSKVAQEILKPRLLDGRAEIGVQLHPWVNPPFEEEVNQYNSYAGNLPEELEREKFSKLRGQIEEAFGVSPLIYRAGRYGLGPNTAQLLADQGLAIDTSVRPLFDYAATGGPDYRKFPLHPYWVDEQNKLLELPLTTTFWGMLRRQGDFIFPRLWRMPSLRGVLSKLGMLERIPLTPEGVSAEEAIRGIDMALDDGLPVLMFSFHSPSLDFGHTPYVRGEEDLDALYDWWRRIFTYLQMRGVKPSCVSDVMAHVIRD